MRVKLEIFCCLPSFRCMLWNCTLPIPQLIGHSLDCLSRIGLRPARLDNLCDYPLQFGILAKVVPTRGDIHSVDKGNVLPVYLRIHLFKLVFFAQRCVVCQTARSHTACIEFVRSLLALMPINCCLHDESLLPALVQRTILRRSSPLSDDVRHGWNSLQIYPLQSRHRQQGIHQITTGCIRAYTSISFYKRLYYYIY